MRAAALIVAALVLAGCSVTLYSREWSTDSACRALASRFLETRADADGDAMRRAGCYLEDAPAYGT